MFDVKKVLAVGAHPDDIEFGCMGFLLKQSTSVEKHVYVASLGSVGDPTTDLRRQEESLNAMSSLKPKTMNVRDKAGIEEKDFNDILSALTLMINDINPDLILGLGPSDTHQEHRRIYEITCAAARRSKASMLNYAILSNTLDFKPSIFVDITDVYDKKKLALRCHVSQKDKYYMTDEYLEIFHSHNYASLHGLRYCEAYEVVRIFS